MDYAEVLLTEILRHKKIIIIQQSQEIHGAVVRT